MNKEPVEATTGQAHQKAELVDCGSSAKANGAYVDGKHHSAVAERAHEELSHLLGLYQGTPKNMFASRCE